MGTLRCFCPSGSLVFGEDAVGIDLTLPSTREGFAGGAGGLSCVVTGVLGEGAEPSPAARIHGHAQLGEFRRCNLAATREFGANGTGRVA